MLPSSLAPLCGFGSSPCTSVRSRVERVFNMCCNFITGKRNTTSKTLERRTEDEQKTLDELAPTAYTLQDLDYIAASLLDSGGHKILHCIIMISDNVYLS